MFYEPQKNDHGLRFAPFKSCVVPRPIAWISTVNASGVVNLAPFSQSNILGWDPPYVMFSAFTRFDGRRKDSVANAEETGEFIFNMATYALRDAVVLTSAIEEAGLDEMAQAGLTPVPSRLVKPPRVAECPISLECKHYQTTILPSDTEGLFNSVVVGRVIGIHIDDSVITSTGKIDVAKIRPLARLGYLDYTSVTDVFEMRPAGTTASSVIGMSGGRIAAE
ncbi:MAG: flavin reductase family protein [Xanthobacteraceae bacterium]|nr:flavin reductase family protein [Xanthobacteraceae bacterium]MBV9630218.1 flavin reductase family protein [Xanthobacteraceae bacterium]